VTALLEYLVAVVIVHVATTIYMVFYQEYRAKDHCYMPVSVHCNEYIYYVIVTRRVLRVKVFSVLINWKLRMEKFYFSKALSYNVRHKRYLSKISSLHKVLYAQ